ncbi:hypothetical protein L226DRAFT_470866 [Lentinus tigrinus ALCF2SS1-7]|uniref:Uncharacterized protein n=1 Tax=Lentinus tigrinus ALCF2SS1-6 TaxID=1328759 RepID=A0A5C2RVE3_9APHY|nr:hypothetical protein L227DRAFT_511520 [Lentinus tigrinus ALCF2SS1-6]RPD70042.1 hypothetical protein L226DRAFT_470866 [Lentinus tigrinus ALCF2SS1-7]
MTATTLHIVHDTGAPGSSADYTTLVLLHGWAWHCGIFSKLIPLAKTYNTRLILVNRRDYPGSTPYTEEERALIAPPPHDASAEDIAAAKDNGLTFMENRAREVYDLLEDLVRREKIPPANRTKDGRAGGIVVAGWSYAAIWMQALLAFVDSFPVHDVDLSTYVRRVVCYDVAYVLSGYPLPEDPYNPLFDSTLADNEKLRAFCWWVSGYYSHGDTPETHEKRTPLDSPAPTFSTLSRDDIAACMHAAPGEVGGSDSNLLYSALPTGLFAILRGRALRLGHGDSGSRWRDVELRWVWGGRSEWQVAYGMWMLRAELRESKERDEQLRDIRIVKIEKANHFVHWDNPDWAMRSLLGDEDVVA